MNTQLQAILKEKEGNVITIDESATIMTAVNLLIDHHIGVLIVYKASKIQGIISERDIMRAIATTKDDIRQHSVKEFMTPHEKLVITTSNDSLDYIMSAMTNNHIRHMPVFDEKEQLIGMISIGDVVKSLLTDFTFENKLLKDYIESNYPR